VRAIGAGRDPAAFDQHDPPVDEPERCDDAVARAPAVDLVVDQDLPRDVVFADQRHRAIAPRDPVDAGIGQRNRRLRCGHVVR
jgi:hypothetical protein